jgi:hypothetical protein
VFIGSSSGYDNVTGEENIFIGYGAGYNEKGSRKLYIDNTNTSSPLVYGDFTSNTLTVNGKLGVGTMIPGCELDVVGAIHCTGKITSVGGYDPEEDRFRPSHSRARFYRVSLFSLRRVCTNSHGAQVRSAPAPR